MTIRESLVHEIIDELEVTGIRLNSAQVNALLDGDDELVEQLEEWGADDTDLLSTLADLLSEHLIGESWPTYGSAKGESPDAFQERLHVAAKAKGFEVIDESSSPAE